MCSYLNQDIELRVVQHYVGPDSQTVVREHCDCLEAGAKLPSYVLEDSEMTELCVRAKGDEDWSQDVQLESRDKSRSCSVVQVESVVWIHMNANESEQEISIWLVLLLEVTLFVLNVIFEKRCLIRACMFVAGDWTTNCGQSEPFLLGGHCGSFHASPHP